VDSRSFDAVWERIVARRREFFRTGGGRYFTYRVEGDCVIPSQTELRIPRRDFELAYQIVPIPNAGKIARHVEGPEYVWAILHDARISQGEW
jgi:hypothetical protein